jgi:hypothetical protein
MGEIAGCCQIYLQARDGVDHRPGKAAAATFGGRVTQVGTAACAGGPAPGATSTVPSVAPSPSPTTNGIDAMPFRDVRAAARAATQGRTPKCGIRMPVRGSLKAGAHPKCRALVGNGG